MEKEESPPMESLKSELALAHEQIRFHTEEAEFFKRQYSEAEHKCDVLTLANSQLSAQLAAEHARVTQFEMELERTRKQLFEANRERMVMELVRLERDELLNRWNDFASYRNEPLLKELEAARDMLERQRQWMRRVAGTAAMPEPM